MSRPHITRETARAMVERADSIVLHDIADGWRTAGEPVELIAAARLELERRFACCDCGAPAGSPCRPDYGCSTRSRAYDALIEAQRARHAIRASFEQPLERYAP